MIESNWHSFLRTTCTYDSSPNSIAKEKTIDLFYKLYDNYPNPFNPKTIINYDLPIMNYVELIIYNNTGQKITTLVAEYQNAGYHHTEWDASGISSGVYFKPIMIISVYLCT